jgi:multisubunit Na+/H+ antiporter MnhG subunit
VIRTVAVDVILAVAVAVVLASAAGLLAMRDSYQKLHYVTPIALIAPLLLGVAVLVRSGFTENSALTWLALLFVGFAGPFLSHATIRAARIRQTGDWRDSGERDGPAGDEP